MKPVRLEILIDDKTLQGLNSVKGNLGSMEQFYKQAIGQLKSELTDLQQKLKAALSEGINTDKQASEIQALTGVVNQLTDELEKLKQAKKQNNATPIIGEDPAPKMNNIKMSMAQIARELPAITMGPQMFFLAISNNIPLLQDALSSARKEFDNLKESGKEATPVWQQVLEAITSPQAAIAVGITLLSVYGDEIIEWGKKVFKTKKEVDALAESEKRLQESREEGLRNSIKERAELKVLYEATQDTTRSMVERNAATDKLQKLYPSYFSNLSNEEILAGKAASAYDKLSNSLVANAEARAIQNKITEIAAKRLEAELKLAEQTKIMEDLEEISQKGTATSIQNANRRVATPGQGMYASNTPVLTEEANAYNQAAEAASSLNDEIKKHDTAIENLTKKIKITDLIGDDETGGINATKTNYAAELAEARIKAQQKLERMLIETMQDGFKKRQALAAQQLQEEIARINADEKAQLDTIKKARAAGQSVDTNAEQQVQDNAQQQRKAANNKYLQDSAQIEKEWQENSLQSWIAYYEKYGTYAQQRVAIIQKYALKMNNTQDENEKALFTKQQEEELQSLDDKFGKSVKQMTDLFEDASNKSVGAIEEIISKYEKLIDYMTNPDSTVTKEDLLSVGFTEKDLKNLENGTIKIADITKALKELKGELKGKSPFKTFSTDLKEAFDKIKNAKGDTKAIGEGLSGIGSAVSEFTPALQQFSSDLSTIFGYDDSKIQGIIGAVGGLGNTAVGIGQALSGDIVGGAMKAVSGIASVISSLEGVFGADYSGYERLKEQYDLLNGVWDTLIDKKKEYISMSYGEEATKAGEEAKKLINDQISRYRQLLDELAGSGASIGSHSLGYRINKRMAKEDWEILSKLVGETIDNSNDLWDLTADQLEKLLQDPKIVSVLGEVNEDFLTYIQDIIDAQDELEEVEKSIQEQLTQTSFENMQDSFWNALLDMEKDAEAFGDDLTKTMQKAIIKANLGKTYESQLQNWYEKFAKANQSDGINTEEYDSLRKEYDAIVEAALKERNELMKVFGWESEAAASAAQSGRAGAVTTITEETAGRLEGIGNAQLDRIIAMDDKMETMGDSLSAMASNIAIMTENSNYLKRLEDIADNIQNMNSTGVKIKG